MKFIVGFFAILLGLVQLQAETASFKIAAYNVRYDAKADDASGNPWQTRKHEVAKLIQRHQFDVVGTQEANASQLQELQSLLPEFSHLTHPYGGREGLSHNAAIFFKTALFDALDSGVFWFSETPDTPSIGWDATDRRITFWTKLRVKSTGQVFFVFNAHFYWQFETARANSGPLLVKKMQEIAGDLPAVAVGDFNSLPGTPQIQAITAHYRDAFAASETPRKGIVNTSFHGGQFQGEPHARIDYLFFSPHFRIKTYEVISDVYATDRYPSDHLPVVSVVELKPEGETGKK